MTDLFKGIVIELAQFPLFKGIANEKIALMCEGGIVKIHKHRDLLFQHGEPAQYFGIVLSGAYKLSRVSPIGEESVIYFSSPGDVVAALVMPQEKPLYPVSVRAMGPSRILLVHRSVYLNQWIKSPDLIMQIQSLLSLRMSRFQNQRLMQRAPMSSKIAAMLMQLVAKDDHGDLEVLLPLTRKEIADTLGVTVESVIRVMSDWVKQGLIVTSEQQIKIIKPDQLVHLIDQE